MALLEGLGVIGLGLSLASSWIRCSIGECCDKPWLAPNFTGENQSSS